MSRIAYERALIKYPDSYFEIYFRPIDETFPEHENIPVSTAPAVRIWPDKSSYKRGNWKKVIADYWLIEEF